MFDVIGQDYAVKTFEKTFENNMVSHAYIITGPDGVGKSIYAMRMASVLMCTGEKKPCGVCSQCMKIIHGNHPDVKLVSNKARSIGVDEIREIINEVYTKPYEGKRRIVIVKNADLITLQGQNAILKTLEEPLNETTIILIAENINAILQTIQSRCQILKLGRIPVETIKSHLMTQGIEESRAITAANLSDGILGNAMRFLDDKFLKLRESTIETARKVIRCDALEAFKCEEFFIANKNEIDTILDIIMSWFRDIMIVKHVRNRGMLINQDYYELLVEESQLLSYNSLSSIIEIINSTREQLRQNTNYQLAVEVMLLNIQEV